MSKIFNKKDRKVETSLIEEFSYPKLGPGQLWEVTAEEIKKLGGTILMNSQVIKIHKNVDNKVTGVTYIAEDTEHELQGDIVISSMPLKDLVVGMNDVPEEELKILSQIVGFMCKIEM